MNWLAVGLITLISGGIAFWLSKPLVEMLSDTPLVASNYTGKRLPTAGGLLCWGAILATSALGSVLQPFLQSLFPTMTWPKWLPWDPWVIALSSGFTLLGLLDDAAGDHRTRGFRAHLSALWHRQWTTGGIKAAGGFALALTMGFSLHSSWTLALLDALLIALSANAINLLDLRPGRALKGFYFSSLIGLILMEGKGAVTILPFVGASLSFFPMDLRKRAMLGDSGANLLGAAFGLWAVLALPLWGKGVLLILLVFFHYWTSSHSLSAWIDRHALLRRFDRWGTDSDL
ncbi:MAG: hypothetical protein IMW91_02515 [Firmicutes bacterium]|nr:hypothetical protein [Bacillota bacterium]